MKTITLPNASTIRTKLEPIGTGTNSSWSSAFVELLAKQAGMSLSEDGMSALVSSVVTDYIRGVPADLRMTVCLKIPDIAQALFADPATAERMAQEITAICFW